jgi:hypothetical protein
VPPPPRPLSPYIQVFTDFTVRHEDTVSLRHALGKAVYNENARLAGGLEHQYPRKPPPGPVERGRLDIVVEGEPERFARRPTSAFVALSSAIRDC